MAVSIHDILRALVGAASHKLNDAEWVAEALAGIDHDEKGTSPDEAAEDSPGQAGVPQFLAPPRA